ncbi:hypothetical protein DFH06DRAFT_1129201 [Mycena polygramma]|nr:hypothetical protein DFH06DRAFT_1146294 [Mycena polygramma]KAJ7662052.1 hypothetical protein DFH06DRAFT_1129201 [Mycena polygramma]
MSELVFQLLPLALTPLAALVPQGIQRSIILALTTLYFAGFVVLPNLPTVRLRKLEQYIEETFRVHAVAAQELEKDPRFVVEMSLRLAQVKFSESDLRMKTLDSEDIPWRKYPQHLRGLSFRLSECQRDIRDIHMSILIALERNRQRTYTEDVLRKQTTLDTAFFNPPHSLLEVGDGSGLCWLNGALSDRILFRVKKEVHGSCNEHRASES